LEREKTLSRRGVRKNRETVNCKSGTCGWFVENKKGREGESPRDRHTGGGGEKTRLKVIKKLIDGNAGPKYWNKVPQTSNGKTQARRRGGLKGVI